MIRATVASAGAALLLALAGPAAAQSTGTIQYQWIEVTVAQFPDQLYLDWFIGSASGRATTGPTSGSIAVPAGTPVGTVATVIVRDITRLETQCHLEVAMPAAQACDPRLVSGARCTVAAGGVSAGICRLSITHNP